MGRSRDESLLDHGPAVDAPLSSSGRRVLSGALWNYGAQAVTIVLQFGYAAITSRTVAAEGFGAYAVSLAVVGLVTLLATGGLGQAVGRLADLERPAVRGLQTYGWVLGSGAALVLVLSGGVWASFWGNSTAAEPIRWLSIVALIAPSTGLATGLMRRTGRFKDLSIITILANTVSMIVGVIATVIWPTTLALIVSPIVAQLLTLSLATYAERELVAGFAWPRRAGSAIQFSRNLMYASMLSYISANTVKFGFSHAHGGSAFGAWNRAEVLSTVPFQHIQNALIQAVYPEFRHYTQSGVRARRVWTDLLVLVAAVTLPISAVAAGILPMLVPIFFGPGWAQSAHLVGVLALAGGVQVVSVVLASAVEALGRFRWVWSTDMILILVQAVGVVAVFRSESILIGPLVLIIAAVVRHLWQIVLCTRAGYLDAALLTRQYFGIIVVCTILGLTTWTLVNFTSDWQVYIRLGLLIGFIASVALCAWIMRSWIHPYQIFRSYLGSKGA
ncbi:oligosaccharide flippase family protein [Rhodococcus opacus]|uniref:oligosaccharide flippase family protein n=1 Tax=Rhodococcus opacus TaxID=37919 RepID=UPI0029497342|nr:oligosaccharide flippase family protein [Rhodococcus opacus]MDV6241226.1 oligosaccharide flippase family protein [Rhodococcus opacus]